MAGLIEKDAFTSLLCFRAEARGTCDCVEDRSIWSAEVGY
jgi:hypothetical protein